MTWAAAGVVVDVWLVVVLCQLGDVFTLFLDSRTARDREPGRLARERSNELFWVVPLVVVLSLGIGVGVDHVSGLVFGSGTPALGALILLGLAVLVVAIAGLALAADALPGAASYVVLRRKLREHEGERLPAEQLAGFRHRLAEVDARHRARAGSRHVFRRASTLLRLAPVIVGLLVVLGVIAAGTASGAAQGTSIAISCAAPVVSALFGLLGVRLAVASDAAWLRVYALQRSEISSLLVRFERSSRTGVAGLGDRVARALAILREQQEK